MKRFTIMFCLLGVLLAARTTVAQTTSGEITADETWSGTVVLTGDVIVTSGTLTITPGTTVKFAKSNDNVVNGSAAHIHLAVMLDGILRAVGTESQPITFTTTSILPSKGSWGRVEFMALNNGSSSIMEHCVLEYARGAAIECYNPDGYSNVMAPVIRYCTIRHIENSGIWGSSGCEPDISHCLIYDTGSTGIFFHGAGTVDISYCTMYDVPAGLVCAGMDGYTQVVNADHLTIYNVDYTLDPTPTYWTGYGVFGTNVAAVLTLTNSIICKATLGGMQVGSMDIRGLDNNCWYDFLEGAISEGSLPANNLETDPMFVDGDAGDLRLDAASLCLNAASDSTHMDAWQGGAASIRRVTAGSRSGMVKVATTPSGLRFRFVDVQGNASVEIMDLSGTTVARLHKADGKAGVTWNRGSLPAGAYLYRAEAGNNVNVNRVIVN